jgi:hypothetical protein
MRIVTIDLDVSFEPCDIEVPLQRLASSPDRRAAARWQLLLNLVRVLRSECRYPEVSGFIIGHEMCLSPASQTSEVWVRIWADSRDYGLVRDGLPILYYRVQVKRLEAPLSADARIERAEEVGRLLEQAFGGIRLYQK